MILDTGSSKDVVIGECCTSETTRTTYLCSSSEACEPSCTAIEINYSGASISGFVVTDTIYSPSLGTVEGSHFVSIQKESDFFREEYEGILGLAYSSLAKPTSNSPASLLTRILGDHNAPDDFGFAAHFKPY
jgi:hypothetical protein